MISAFVWMVAFQSSAPVRELRANLERRYRVKVEQQDGDQFAYRLQMKISAPKALADKSPDVRLMLNVTDYKATMAGQPIHMAKMGGGDMLITTSGLPGGINIAGPQGPIWLPMLSLYLPMVSDDGDFAINRTDIGSHLLLAGKGKLARTTGKAQVDLDATVERDGKEIGKLTMQTSFDPQGWPVKSVGTLVSADGTYRFTLDRG